MRIQRVASISPPRMQFSATANTSEPADDIIEMFAKSLLAEAYDEAFASSGGASSGGVAPHSRCGLELPAFSAREEPDVLARW